MRLTTKLDNCYHIIHNWDARNTFEDQNKENFAFQKLGQLEDIEEWFSKKVFYGTALNEPNKILELKFENLDFRAEEDLLLIHFKVLNSWATSIFYNILEYGKTWSLDKKDLTKEK